MSVPITEMTLETVIRDALGAIRANPDVFDDLFSKFKEAFFIHQFGQTQIDRLKYYIQHNQIRIVQSWSLVPTSMPCISIELIRASEDEDLQHFNYGYEEVDSAITPAVRVPIVTPGVYDTLSGKLTITNAADLSNVCPGMNFVDASNIKFQIQSGNSNLSGNKYINIGSGQTPDLSADGRIESFLDKKRTERRMIRLREQLRIGCHAKDDLHLTKYMYYLLIYILKSRQATLISRGIHLDKTLGEVFDRADEFQGENVYSRFIEFFCITEFDWNQAEVNLIDCFDLTVKAPMPNPDSANAYKINTSDD